MSSSFIIAAQIPEDPIGVLMHKAIQQNPLDDSARIYLEEVIRMAEQAHDSGHETEGHYRLGRHYFLRMETGKAQEHFLRARQLSIENKDWEKAGFSNVQLGLGSIQENELDSAISFFQQAISLYMEHDLPRHLWTPYVGISSAFHKAGNVTAAFRYGRQAVASIPSAADRISKVIAYKHILRLAREHDSLQVYSVYADALLKLYSPLEINDKVLQHIDHFVNIENPAERIDAIHKVIDRLNKWPLTLELISSYYQLGQSYAGMGDSQAAIRAWHAAYRLEKDSLRIVHFTPALLRALSKQYEHTGHLRQALDYYKAYASVSDSLQQVNIKTRTEELQLQFESRSKDEQIAGQQQMVHGLTTQRNTIIGMSMILLIAGGFMFNIQRRHMKDQTIIAEQKEALHENEILQLKKQHEVTSLHMLITVQEEERKRIAQDLHDSLGALLAALRNKTRQSHDPATASSATDQLKLIDAVNTEVRRIAYNMMPPALIHMGLSAAIDDLVDALRQDGPLHIFYQNIDYDQALHRDKEISLFRIVQELCTNAIRHAEAAHLQIQLSGHNGSVTLVVEDDGIGFDSKDYHHGIGMDSIRSRVEYLNGTMEIWALPGEGTSITINVPVT